MPTAVVDPEVRTAVIVDTRSAVVAEEIRYIEITDDRTAIVDIDSHPLNP